jgi:hypothetical protein
MTLARLSFDLWRPVGLAPITTAVAVLRRAKARTLEATLEQGGKQVARCTAVLLRIDAASAPHGARAVRASAQARAGRPVLPQVKAWSPFFTGVDTRRGGGPAEAGPASAWFNLGRPLVAGENSPFVHALSAPISRAASAIVDLRVWTFVNADLTVTFWRTPRRGSAERGDGGGRSGNGRHTGRAVGRRRPVRCLHADAHLRAPARVPSCLSVWAAADTVRGSRTQDARRPRRENPGRRPPAQCRAMPPAARNPLRRE